MSIVLDSSTLHSFILERAKALVASSRAHFKVILCEVDEPTRQHRLRTRKKRISQSKSHLVPRIASAQFKALPENTLKVNTKKPVKAYIKTVLEYIEEEERKEAEQHHNNSAQSTHSGKQVALSGSAKSKSWLPFNLDSLMRDNSVFAL